MSLAVSLAAGGSVVLSARRTTLARRRAVNRRFSRVTPRASSEGGGSEDGDKSATPTPTATTAGVPGGGGEGRFKRRDPDAAPPKPSPLGAGPAAPATSGIKVIPVEQRSRDAFQGVAKADAALEDPTLRNAKLVAGDAAAILLFAAIGRGNHGEGFAAGEVLATALPFLVGWFAAAPVAGTFGDDARGTEVGAAAAAAAKAWALGIPAGLVLRSVGKGQLPPQPFVIVTMVATGVLLVGWRAGFAKGGAGGGNGNKVGNPLEFMNLLMGLTKRW
mmetsp:Transcript_42517/g.68381  ORF Transcript_42517/g.68381 Transcript_42517/m.68381 type:complete len:275 (-) Transcript_42517:509-1333(-)|eukprot:CAMPEP_0198707116 /NCGR_PEP_ID=MMETSP1468-20131203/391316_1 /TAXON_ID=1461545 /ORGANISM="Mantoniella sp, Strain CCMP1436" /LENGTH=274 /DNA_ID=CAMNT_0044466079 /DNA_START=48 /DNA_END=872 /DNA_ORIENTATION=+